MVARVLLPTLLLAGCGRFAFDAAGDGGAGGDAAPGDGAPADGLAVLAGCVLHLAMDEASWSGTPGEVANGCPGLSGRAVGGATVIDDPLRGRVGLFVGDPSCVEIGDAPALNPTDQLTMSAWVYPTALDGSTPYGIVSKRAGYLVDAQYTLFIWTGDTPWVDLDTEDDRFDTATALPAATWTQLTVVFDGRLTPDQRVRVYRDGVLEHTAAESSATIPTLASPLTVGCMPDLQGSEVSFVGRLDDVAVWTRALDPTEVTAWYEATRR